MGTGNPWLYFSTTRWHLRGKSGQTRDWSWGRFDSTFAKRKRVKPREKQRSPVKPRQTSTFLWIFLLFVCAFWERTKLGTSSPELPTSQTATRVTQRTTSAVTRGSSWFFWIHFLGSQSWTANMMILGLLMCFGILVETSFLFIYNHGMLPVVFEPISEKIDPIDLGGKTATTLLKMRKCICPFLCKTSDLW